MHRLDVTEEPPRRVFALPHRGPYAEIGPVFDRLADIAAAHGLDAAGQTLIGIFYDDPGSVAADALRSHAGIVVNDEAACPPGLEQVRLEGGRHAVLRVTGPYSGLYPAYVWLYGEGLAEAGLTALEGASFEIYRNDPCKTAEADLITDIFVRIA